MDAAAIEGFFLRAWPALEERALGSWRLRFAGGYTKRSNSVVLLGGPQRDLEGSVQKCEAAYAERALPVVFKINDFSPDAGPLDALLEKRGYALADPCLVLGLDLPEPFSDCGAALAADEAETPDLDEWLAVHGRLAGLKDVGRHRRIVSRIDLPCLHAAARHDGRFAACGLVVLDQPLCAIFDLLVREDVRRRGIGRLLSRYMLAWAARHGAKRVVLQALVDNEPAQALYCSLGFVPLYRYWYRRQF